MNLRKFFDIMIPRFITEEVAVIRVGRKSSVYDIVCSMRDVRPGESFDGIATVRTFNLFGQGLFPHQIGPTRPWASPHRMRTTA